jgi:hypothetical protein
MVSSIGKELASIIQEDNLQIESEDRLCDTVFQWLENDLEKRQKFCGNLFEHIRISGKVTSPLTLSRMPEQNMASKYVETAASINL